MDLLDLTIAASALVVFLCGVVVGWVVLGH